MHLTKEFLQELELLALFDLHSSQVGLKIHHEAPAERIAAARRLFEKNITTLEDGGYLTLLGIEAAEHAQALVSILQPVK
ncbi:MAG: TIGR02647 family protein [Pseudohongiellaceae bacterium]